MVLHQFFGRVWRRERVGVVDVGLRMVRAVVVVVGREVVCDLDQLWVQRFVLGFLLCTCEVLVRLQERLFGQVLGVVMVVYLVVGV